MSKKITRKKSCFMKCYFILVWLLRSKSFSSSVGRLSKASRQNKGVRLKRHRKHRNALFWKSQTKQTQKAEKNIYLPFTTFWYCTKYTASLVAGLGYPHFDKQPPSLPKVCAVSMFLRNIGCLHRKWEKVHFPIRKR